MYCQSYVRQDHRVQQNIALPLMTSSEYLGTGYEAYSLATGELWESHKAWALACQGLCHSVTTSAATYDQELPAIPIQQSMQLIEE